MKRFPHLLLVLALAAPAGTLAAQPAPADTTRQPVAVGVSPKIDSFYSPARGFGAGAEVTLEHLGWNHSVLSLEATVMSRHGEYHAFFFTHEPRTARVYGAAGLSYTGTRAWTFYGLGPRSHADDGVRLTARRVAAEARGGWYPLAEHRLALQPVVRLLYTSIREFEEATEGALLRLDAPSQASLERAAAAPSTGIEFGAGVVYDAIDDPRYPRRGALLQAGMRRYAGLDDDPFAYVASSAIAHVAIPVHGQRTIVQLRAVAHVTRPAGGTTDLPFFALQTVDSDLVGGYSRFRLVGRDALALSAGLRFPVLDVFNWIGAEGFVAVHAANAYDNLFTQFEPRLSLARHLDRDGDRAPLRLALTLGGHLVDLGEGRPMISGQIGVSPEGFELAGLAFTVDLRQRRPYVR
jgi:hypothetical protein